MMISALKITAERIADSGLASPMMLSLSSPAYTPANIAGMIAKYFATSLAMEKVVSAPRVMSSCLPISTISMSLVGLESRSTMLPASLADDVPVFIATPTSACASAGRVVGAVAGHRDQPAALLLLADQRHLVLGRGLGEEVVDARPPRAIARAVSGLSPVIITVRMPIRRISSKRSRMPSLTTSLRWITPRARACLAVDISATTSGVPPLVEMASTMSPTSAVG